MSAVDEFMQSQSFAEAQAAVTRMTRADRGRALVRLYADLNWQSFDADAEIRLGIQRLGVLAVIVSDGLEREPDETDAVTL